MINNIYKLGKKLFTINRSITGNGVRLTLLNIKKELKKLKIHEVRSGTRFYDWKIPPEWNVKKAYVKDKNGKIIIDIKNNNLHLVGYSTPCNFFVNKSKLLEHIHSIKNQPNAIPYITSYYKKYWGFCVTDNLRKKIKKNYLNNDKFLIKIDSNFKKKGSLTYGEFILPGKSKKEILISTNICHPQMANNELSGPLVALALAKHFSKYKNEKTLRFVFIPETIGAIAYLNLNYNELKRNVIAGYTLSCIGDQRSYSFIPTKYGSTISDKAAKKAFEELNLKYKKFSFLKRGSDERQYNSPGIDLPIASILRTKYLEFPEYHTSLDNFNLMTKRGLLGGYKIVKKTIEIIMNEIIPVSKEICEPKLQKKNLYKSLSIRNNFESTNLPRIILNFLQYADGKNTIHDISKHIKIPINKTLEIYKLLYKQNLLEKN